MYYYYCFLDISLPIILKNAQNLTTGFTCTIMFPKNSVITPTYAVKIRISFSLRYVFSVYLAEQHECHNISTVNLKELRQNRPDSFNQPRHLNLPSLRLQEYDRKYYVLLHTQLITTGNVSLKCSFNFVSLLLDYHNYVYNRLFLGMSGLVMDCTYNESMDGSKVATVN